jgi:hypothetical protein
MCTHKQIRQSSSSRTHSGVHERMNMHVTVNSYPPVDRQKQNILCLNPLRKWLPLRFRQGRLCCENKRRHFVLSSLRTRIRVTNVQRVFCRRFGKDPPQFTTIYTCCIQYENKSLYIPGVPRVTDKLGILGQPDKSTYGGSHEFNLPQTTVCCVQKKHLRFFCSCCRNSNRKGNASDMSFVSFKRNVKRFG